MKQRRVFLLVLLAVACDGPSGPRPVRLDIRASALALAVGDTAVLEASVFDESDNELIPSDGSATIDRVSFSATPGGIITVVGSTVRAVGRGTAQLRATLQGTTATLTFTVAGVSHRSAITTSETWRAVDGPHVVRTLIDVGGTTTLTIEPGAEVRFSRRAGLRFTGSQAILHAVGTAAAPIRMVADTIDPPPGTSEAIVYGWFKGHWSGVRLSSSASQMRYVQMRYCGGDGIVRGCVMIEGDGDRSRPVLQNVSIVDGALVGVSLREGGGFGASSANLTITGTGSVHCHCYGGGAPIASVPNAAGTIPTSLTLSGNYTNHIILYSGPEGGRVSETQTWPDLGIPYVASDSIRVSAPGAPILTLASGVELQFHDAFSTLFVGDDGPGDLVAAGTSASPVVLTTEGSYWNGIIFGPGVSAASRLDHAFVDSAGGYNAVYQWGAAVVVQKNGLDQLFTNTTFRSQVFANAPCDIRRAWTPESVNTDYTAPALGNTFTAKPRVTPQCGPP